MPVRNKNLHAEARVRTAQVPIEDLAADADITARPIFAAPETGATIRKIGVAPQGNKAGVDASNTSVWIVKDGAGNTLVSKTYNNSTVFPASGVYGDLGTLNTTHKELTANETLTLTITNGSTADLPASLLVIEWEPKDS